MNYEARISELNLQLPPATAPKGLYRPLVVAGNFAYLSGHVSARLDGSLIQGKVGDTLDMEAGKLAARASGMGRAVSA